MRKILSILTAFIFLSLSCENPFVTREPEDPTKNTSTFIPPTSPEIVFANLQIAFSERNAENYIRSFVDSSLSESRFMFVPDQNVAARVDVFLNWTLEDERQYIVRAFQATPRDSIIELRFNEIDRGNETASTLTITQDYEIKFGFDSDEYPEEVQGQSIFYLERNELNVWAIHRWDDFKTNENVDSWTELKVKFQ